MKINNYLPKDLAIFLSAAALIIALFSFALFGVTGIRIFLGIIMMWLPFYFILGNFEISQGERAVFSIIFGVTLFPSIAFLIGFLISFRMAIAVTFLLLVGAAFLISRLKKK